MFAWRYQDVERVLGALLVLSDGGEHRQNQAGEHQQEPEHRTGKICVSGKINISEVTSL